MQATELTPQQTADLAPTAEERAAWNALKPAGTSQEVWDAINRQIDQEEAVELADIHQFLVEEYPDEMAAAQVDIRPPVVHDESVMTPVKS